MADMTRGLVLESSWLEMAGDQYAVNPSDAAVNSARHHVRTTSFSGVELESETSLLQDIYP